jgi:hypothetical protein
MTTQCLLEESDCSKYRQEQTDILKEVNSFISARSNSSDKNKFSANNNCNNNSNNNPLDDSLTSLQWLQHLSIKNEAAKNASSSALADPNEINKLDVKRALIETVSSEFKFKLNAIASREAIEYVQNTECENSVYLKNNKSLSQTNSLILQNCENFKNGDLGRTVFKLKAKNKTNVSSKCERKKKLKRIKSDINENGSIKTSLSNTITDILKRKDIQDLKLTQDSQSITNNTAIDLLKRRKESYVDNSDIKPPFSYSQLIILAMKESTFAKMTLQMIYDWIIENFSYFKKADPNWQITFKNSIRHNLSLNKCFKKIARQKNEPGKGGFWTLDPDFEKKLNESIDLISDEISQGKHDKNSEFI